MSSLRIVLTLLVISGDTIESNLELDGGMFTKLGDAGPRENNKSGVDGLFNIFPNGVDFLADFKLSNEPEEDALLFVTSLNANNTPFLGVCKSIAAFFDGWTKSKMELK